MSWSFSFLSACGQEFIPSLSPSVDLVIKNNGHTTLLAAILDLHSIPWATALPASLEARCHPNNKQVRSPCPKLLPAESPRKLSSYEVCPSPSELHLPIHTLYLHSLDHSSVYISGSCLPTRTTKWDPHEAIPYLLGRRASTAAIMSALASLFHNSICNPRGLLSSGTTRPTKTMEN